MQRLIVNPTVDENGVKHRTVTAGHLIDLVSKDETLVQNRDKSVTSTFKLKDIIEMAGRDHVQETILSRTAAAMYNPSYINDP